MTDFSVFIGQMTGSYFFKWKNTYPTVELNYRKRSFISKVNLSGVRIIFHIISILNKEMDLKSFDYFIGWNIDYINNIKSIKQSKYFKFLLNQTEPGWICRRNKRAFTVVVMEIFRLNLTLATHIQNVSKSRKFLSKKLRFCIAVIFCIK